MPPTFCPNCANCLTISQTEPTLDCPAGMNAFECRTCPYRFILDKPYFERTYMKKKQRDDVLGAGDTNLPTTKIPKCQADNCSNQEAYFYQMQTRSADEPPTSFYRCTICSKQWREY